MYYVFVFFIFEFRFDGIVLIVDAHFVDLYSCFCCFILKIAIFVFLCLIVVKGQWFSNRFWNLQFKRIRIGETIVIAAIFAFVGQWHVRDSKMKVSKPDRF